MANLTNLACNGLRWHEVMWHIPRIYVGHVGVAQLLINWLKIRLAALMLAAFCSCYGLQHANWSAKNLLRIRRNDFRLLAKNTAKEKGRDKETKRERDEETGKWFQVKRERWNSLVTLISIFRGLQNNFSSRRKRPSAQVGGWLLLLLLLYSAGNVDAWVNRAKHLTLIAFALITFV